MSLQLGNANISHAWDNRNVHPLITQAAIEYAHSTLGLQEIYDHGFFDIGVDDELSSIDEGSVKEDMGYSPTHCCPVKNWLKPITS